MDIRKTLSIFLLAGMAMIPGFAQEDDEFEGSELKSFKERKLDWSKFAIEPNIAFAYSGDFFLVGVAPYVGYEVAKNTYVGPGVVYYFSQVRNFPVFSTTGSLLNRININEHTAGAGIFGQYFFYKQGFVRAKFEMLSRKSFSGAVDQDFEPLYSKFAVPVLLLGVGYNMAVSKNFMFPIMVSYDVIQNSNSPYIIGDFPLYIQLGFVSYF